MAAVNVFKGTDWSVTRGSLTGAGSFTIYFKTKLDSYAMYWKPEQVQELNVAPGEFLVVFEGRGQGNRF